jgi:hypothetical protein
MMLISLESFEMATRKRRSKADLSMSKKLKHHDSQYSESVTLHASDLILQKYQDAAHDCSVDSSATSVWLALNVVLDNTTFENSLLQHDISFKHEENMAPLLTRSYEEQFMRECICEEFPHDKPCSMGQYCECNFIDDENPFVGVAFVMPELQVVQNSMCILCLRKLTLMLFYRVVNGAFKCDHLVQLYGNICDVPGEYHSSAMLVLPKHCAVHSMPLPVVAHQRNKYSIIFKNGHRYLKQKNVYFEDFP